MVSSYLHVEQYHVGTTGQGSEEGAQYKFKESEHNLTSMSATPTTANYWLDYECPNLSGRLRSTPIRSDFLTPLAIDWHGETRTFNLNHKQIILPSPTSVVQENWSLPGGRYSSPKEAVVNPANLAPYASSESVYVSSPFKSGFITDKAASMFTNYDAENGFKNNQGFPMNCQYKKSNSCDSNSSDVSSIPSQWSLDYSSSADQQAESPPLHNFGNLIPEYQFQSKSFTNGERSALNQGCMPNSYYVMQESPESSYVPLPTRTNSAISFSESSASSTLSSMEDFNSSHASWPQISGVPAAQLSETGLTSTLYNVSLQDQVSTAGKQTKGKRKISKESPEKSTTKKNDEHLHSACERCRLQKRKCERSEDASVRECARCYRMGIECKSVGIPSRRKMSGIKAFKNNKIYQEDSLSSGPPVEIPILWPHDQREIA